MIQVKNLNASFGKKEIFKCASFEICKGDFVCLCGKNGSGKSTLLSLLDAIYSPSLKVSGEIYVNGKSIFELSRKEIACKISYLCQKENPCYDLTVNEFLQNAFYAKELNFLQDKKNSQTQHAKLIQEALLKVNMSEFLERKIFSLSGGEFQKVRIARTLLMQTEIIILDEPLENLDISFENEFLTFLKNLSINENKTIIFSIHNINIASLFVEKFMMISDKKIISGKKSELFTSKVLSQVYQKKCEVYFNKELNSHQVKFE